MIISLICVLELLSYIHKTARLGDASENYIILLCTCLAGCNRIITVVHAHSHNTQSIEEEKVYNKENNNKPVLIF